MSTELATSNCRVRKSSLMANLVELETADYRFGA